MKADHFPLGWDEERVRKILLHYETQSDNETVAEDEAALEAQDQSHQARTNKLNRESCFGTNNAKHQL
jgi:hypothetical protein